MDSLWRKYETYEAEKRKITAKNWAEYERRVKIIVKKLKI